MSRQSAQLRRKSLFNPKSFLDYMEGSDEPNKLDAASLYRALASIRCGAVADSAGLPA